MTPLGRVVIAGGTGFLGHNLARHLVDLAYEVVVIARHAAGNDGRWHQASWDARTVGEWAQHLDGATALVNLAGRSVDCVKTVSTLAQRDPNIREALGSVLIYLCVSLWALI